MRQTSTVETFRDKSSKSAQKRSVEEQAICIYEILKNSKNIMVTLRKTQTKGCRDSD